MKLGSLAGVGVAASVAFVAGCGDGSEPSAISPPSTSQAEFPRSGSQSYEQAYAMAEDFRKGGQPCTQFDVQNYKYTERRIRALCKFGATELPIVTLVVYPSPSEAAAGVQQDASSSGGNYYVYGRGNWIVTCPELTSASKAACDAAQMVVGGTVHKFP